MSEPKPIASLSSVLLARKGAARPAMRRPTMTGQNFNGAGGGAAVAQDDLGWNDMGYDVDPDPTTPMDYEHDTGNNPLAAAVPDVKPEVKVQQDRIAEQLHVQAEKVTALHPQAAPAPVVPINAAKAKTPRAAPGSKEKSAFTLRLDGERHLRLRLACAVGNKSAQQLVTAALDAFIDSMPEIGALASQLPAKKRNEQG
jgi:hypothetical protein